MANPKAKAKTRCIGHDGRGNPVFQDPGAPEARTQLTLHDHIFWVSCPDPDIDLPCPDGTTKSVKRELAQMAHVLQDMGGQAAKNLEECVNKLTCDFLKCGKRNPLDLPQTLLARAAAWNQVKDIFDLQDAPYE